MISLTVLGLLGVRSPRLARGPLSHLIWLLSSPLQFSTMDTGLNDPGTSDSWMGWTSRQKLTLFLHRPGINLFVHLLTMFWPTWLPGLLQVLDTEWYARPTRPAGQSEKEGMKNEWMRSCIRSFRITMGATIKMKWDGDGESLGGGGGESELG